MSDMSKQKKMVLGSVTGVCLLAAGVLFYFQFSGGSASPVTPAMQQAESKNDEIQKQMQAAQPKPPPTAPPADFERKVTRGAVAPPK
jgi:hypothetical protein